MTLHMPDGLKWLAWVAGTTWPEGDEDAAWAVAEAWRTASKELEALLAGIDAAKQATVAAYPQGEGGTAMGARYDILRTGDQSVEALAKLMSTVGDSAFDMGTEMQATKITVIVTLAWLAMEILWAWLFPPTAPAVEAAAITTTRSFLKVFEDFVQKAITNLAARLGAPTVKRHFWSHAVKLRPVLPTAKGYGVYGARAIEAAAITGGINGAVQVGQIADGKRRHFNGGEFGLSILAGVAGMIPGREAGRYLGKGIDKVAGKNLDNMPGRIGRGAVIGGVSGAVGTAFGNVAAGAVTGDWSSFSSGAGWVGGIARGGILGGARGGFALGTPIPPGRGDIRSYVWMPKPAAGNTGRPPVVDGSSTGGSRPGSTTTASTGGGSRHSVPVASTNGGSESAGGVSRPGSVVVGGGGSTHSGRGGGSTSGSSGESVYHSAAASQHSGGGQSSRPSTPVSASTGSGHSVYHDPANTYTGSSSAGSSSSSSTRSGGSVYTTASEGSTSGGYTGRPPTSWESSVDGWGPNGRPPQGFTGTEFPGGAPSVSSGSTGHVPTPLPGGAPSVSSGSTGHVPAPPSGGTPSVSSGSTGHPPVPGGVARPDDPFLGEGKDLRGKPRPKQWPFVEPLPRHYEPPTGGAGRPGDWLPPPPVPEPGAHAATSDPENVDVPFTL